jgi:hypothetical protein
MRIDVDFRHREIEAGLRQLYARMHVAGDVLHGMSAIPVPGAPSHLVFRYRETDGEFYVYVEDPLNRALAGCTVFNRVPDIDRQAARHLRSPHSRFAKEYTQKGLASAVYRWALDAGLCLVSGPRQSHAAWRLWGSLARTHELLFVQAGARRMVPMSTSIQRPVFERFETRMVLLGAGWTAARFARLAQ